MTKTNETNIIVHKVTGNTFMPCTINTSDILSTKLGDKQLSSIISPIKIRDARKKGLINGISSCGTKIFLRNALPIHVIEPKDRIDDLIHM